MIYPIPDGITLTQWLAAAEVRARCIYHCGLPLWVGDRPAIAEEAWKLACAGKLILVQRRVSLYACEYIAQKPSKRMPRHMIPSLKAQRIKSYDDTRIAKRPDANPGTANGHDAPGATRARVRAATRLESADRDGGETD